MSAPTAVPSVELTTLSDGGQRPADIARGIVAFLVRAGRTLDIAVYDVRFETDAGALVLGLLAAYSAVSGLLYNVAHPGPIPVPPPPETAPDAIEAFPVETRGIAGVPDLMHHKFVVRDEGVVWTGSTNWTDDRSRQENVIVTLDAREIAYAYSLAFEQLWASGTVEHTGDVEPRPQDVDGARVAPGSAPSTEALSHRIAKHVGKARSASGSRPRCSPPGRSWDARRGRAGGSQRTSPASSTTPSSTRCSISGARTASASGRSFLRTVIEGAPWSGKVSIPWTPESVHDFMHAKVVVADDTSFVGELQPSPLGGAKRGERRVEIRDAGVADRLAAIDGVRASVRARPLPAEVPRVDIGNLPVPPDLSWSASADSALSRLALRRARAAARGSARRVGRRRRVQLT